MSGIAAQVQMSTLRRVLRIRALNSGPLMMERKADRHEPVMVSEVLEALQPRAGAVVVDGTLGLGGHTQHILERIAPNGTLVGFDWDASMIQIASDRLLPLGDTRLLLFNKNYREIKPVMGDLGLHADSILLDLGLNSAQLDDPVRGLSFLREGPLDMRMDRTSAEPASALLNRLGPGEIEMMLLDHGDERWARAIARQIVERRKASPLRTTTDLVDCVLAAVPPKARDRRIHPATRTFQAVRIYVNRELEGLDQALLDAADTLSLGGVLAVLSYHSGEDRIVKHAFRDLTTRGYQELHRKPVLPTDSECRRNPRSRSAKLRAISRISG